MATRINFPVPTNLGNLADPALAQDGATKNYVDGVQQLETSKNYCAWGTLGNITLSGLDVQTGVGEWTATLNAGDRILVKAQTDASKNGIYVASASTWTRALDANTWAKIVSANAFINQGATLATTGWISNVTPVGTLETTAINFIQFTASTPSSGYWPVGYSLISATNAKLGASNKPTVIGGNNTDCITLGDVPTEVVNTVSGGIPAVASQGYSGGIGVYAGNVYVSQGSNSTNGNIWTGPINNPDLNIWSQSFTGNFPSYFLKINGDSTYVITDSYGVVGDYTVKVGNISADTSAISTQNGCAFYDAIGSSIVIQDISVTSTGGTNYLHVIGESLGRNFIAEYQINVNAGVVTLASGRPGKVAPNNAGAFWLNCAYSADRVSYAIGTAGDLYAVDFAPATATTTLAVSGFTTYAGPYQTFIDANVNYVAAIGSDNTISLYNISTQAVTRYSAVPLITYAYGIAVDTSGQITIVGANSAGTTVYLSQPALQVISQFLVPAQPSKLLDWTGNSLGNNQLFANGNRGLQKITDGIAGQSLTFTGAGNIPVWSGGLREYSASTVQSVAVSTDTIVLYDTVVTTVGDIGLTLRAGVFTNNTGDQLILDVSYQVAFEQSSYGSRVVYIGLGSFPSTNRRAVLDGPASTDFPVLSSTAKIVLAADASFYIGVWQNSLTSIGINGAYAGMLTGQSSFIQIQRILS
jgi:hypothetical protein